MWNSLSRGSPASGDSWKWTQEPPCFAITIWCAIKIAHQQTCALLPTGERANCSRGDQGLWTVQRELRGLTMSGPALRFKCTAVGFPVITSLASFWNSESQGFCTRIIMDQSQSTKIQVRICSEHGNFQGKTFISNSLNWPCHDSAFVCSTAKISLNR